MANRDLPDINVWLALTWEDHQHHKIARQYWENEASPQLAFCRVTMLGLLRLATNPKVMRRHAFTAEEAWGIYRAFLALPDVHFIGEPTDLESVFATHSGSVDFSANLWTDAYLAALAQTAECRLVSFDKDFHRFPGLEFLHLQAM